MGRWFPDRWRKPIRRRCIGGDWPHPRLEGEMPDAGGLLELFQAWTPDKATRHRNLVDNSARLYGFPN